MLLPWSAGRRCRIRQRQRLCSQKMWTQALIEIMGLSRNGGGM
jgi:hypothetical protein